MNLIVANGLCGIVISYCKASFPQMFCHERCLVWREDFHLSRLELSYMMKATTVDRNEERVIQTKNWS